MNSTPILDPIDAEEEFVVAFDFTSELFGQSIVSAVVSVTLAEQAAADAAPAELLVGALAIVNGDVLQRIAGRFAGNTYKLRCRATLADGQRRVRAALLPIREA